jgi:hypothetical protein
MSRSKTGPFAAKDFENDPAPRPHVDEHYSPRFIDWRNRLITQVKSQSAAARASKK